MELEASGVIGIQQQPSSAEMVTQPEGNFARFQHWVKRYQELNSDSKLIPRTEVDQLFAPLGLKATDIISPDGHQLHEQVIQSFVDHSQKEAKKEQLSYLNLFMQIRSCRIFIRE
ncbi:hypothetical protein HYS95_02505 [Candidatus Daviesbacteria bacterium]|nr:hypothetical protein [Candidatus Daviesbacteria bacterium]